MNKVMRKRASQGVSDIQSDEFGDMRKKFFYLDHTAEVLENYRRLKENEIFDKILHDGRMKKAFLKNEGSKAENLIGDFDSKFKGYQYNQDSSNSTSSFEEKAARSSLEFMQENQVFENMKEMKGLIREYHRLKGEGEDEAVLQGIVAKYDLLQQDAPGVDKWQAPTIESSQKSEH